MPRVKFIYNTSFLLILAACGYDSTASSGYEKTDMQLPYYLQLSYNVCVANGFRAESELRQCTIRDATLNCELYNHDFLICDQLLGKSDEPFVWPA